mgnify:CR=1 FL=1
MDAISENVIPRGVMPAYSRFAITTPLENGSIPLGMTFPEMASMTGGGVQTPGFMGHGCALAEGTAIFGFVVGLLIVVMLG